MYSYLQCTVYSRLDIVLGLTNVASLSIINNSSLLSRSTRNQSEM